MLVATIEVWPYGEEEAKYQTSRLFIANVKDLGFGQCMYRAHLRRDDDVPLRFTEDNSVEFQHSRKNGDTVCVQKAIEAIPTSIYRYAEEL
jgi:hypothetical protein